MHVELIVPGLLAAAGQRLPALELLAARGRHLHAEPAPPERWLATAFGVETTPVPAGALTLLAAGQSPGDAFWLRADPVHLEVGAHGATLTPSTALRIVPEESEILLAALNRHFSGDFAWIAAHAQRWCVGATAALALDAEVPAEATRDETGVAGGRAAPPKAQALLAEVQMLLHGHAVNEARARRGALTVNSVWLWGAGPLPLRAAGPWQSVLADDPVAAGLAKLAGLRCAALPPHAEGWLAQAPSTGRHLVVLDALRASPGDAGAVASLEAHWFAPLLAALRADRVGMVTLDDPEAGRRWETTRGDLRRFWRRARALGAPP